MIRVIICLFALSIASPIWPIGENPQMGDPFLIVNKQSNEIAYINEGKIKEVYRVSTGKTEDLTPEGEFTIIVKAKNPFYRKRNIEGGDPANPLGTRWIGFDAKETDGRIYGVHGTNSPPSIGRYVTAGCVRMMNEEVEALFDEVPLGTKILIVDTDETFEDLARQRHAIE